MRVLRASAAAMLIILAGLAFLPNNPIRLIEAPLVAPLDDAGDADAAVVLGAGLRINGELTALADERVRTAVEYYQLRGVPLIFSGGKTSYGIEAERMHARAIELGYEGEKLIEAESTSTYENALFTDALLDQTGYDHIAVITSPYHTKRAQRTFSKLMPERRIQMHFPQPGVFASNHPLDRLKALRSLLREYAANAWYRLYYQI